MKQKGICMKRIAYITIACAFLSVSFAKAQQIRTLKDCLEEGLQNNYSLRIVHNEEQISKNNATLGNAGYLPTLDFSAGYTGNLDNIETKARATGEITKNTGVYDQTVNVGLNLNWTIFDGFNISTTYKQLKELERQGETNTRIAIEDFIAELTSEYYNYIQQKIRLANFRYAMSLSKERLRIAEASHLVGKFSGLDYQQAKKLSASSASTKTSSAKKHTTDKAKTSKPIAVREVKVVKQETATPAPAVKSQESANHPFHIIVAGGISLKDAEVIANQLKSKGFADAKALNTDGKVRVSISSFNNRDEATKQLLELRKNETYKNAWLLAK